MQKSRVVANVKAGVCLAAAGAIFFWYGCKSADIHARSAKQAQETIYEYNNADTSTLLKKGKIEMKIARDREVLSGWPKEKAAKYYEAAIKDFSKFLTPTTDSVKIDAKDMVDALAARGRAHLEVGEQEKAFADFNALVERFGKTEFLFWRGWALAGMNKYIEAFADFDEYKESSREYSYYWYAYTYESNWHRKDKLIPLAIEFAVLHNYAKHC